MLQIKEMTYPDGTTVEKLNLVSNQITLTKMDAIDWDSFFSEEGEIDPALDINLMDCFFSLTSVLSMIDEAGNKIDATTLPVGETLSYKGEEYKIYDSNELENVFGYIIDKTTNLKKELESGGIN
tara:strand:- start:694 stop:1068 length:375 start_codon:yes stop_codon:yes gene_type:complete